MAVSKIKMKMSGDNKNKKVEENPIKNSTENPSGTLEIE